MEVEDDRTPEERRTHRVLIIGTDSFLSGWGKANGGASYAAWACTTEDEYAVDRWVRSRGDMKRVRSVFDSPARRYSPKGRGHCHIYVVGPEHPAIGPR